MFGDAFDVVGDFLFLFDWYQGRVLEDVEDITRNRTFFLELLVLFILLKLLLVSSLPLVLFDSLLELPLMVATVG